MYGIVAVDKGSVGGSAAFLKSRDFLGHSSPSSKHMLRWMNSLIGIVSYPFITALCKFSMNDVNVIYMIIEQFAIFVCSHSCFCLSSQMQK